MTKAASQSFKFLHVACSLDDLTGKGHDYWAFESQLDQNLSIKD